MSENLGGQVNLTKVPDDSQGRKISIMVVDDHEVVRKGLVMVIGLEPDIEICCEAGSGTQAVEQARQMRPDMILMDLKMPGMNGIEAARAIKATMPQCKILILTGVDADATIFEALESGIEGYILKEVPPEELVRAVRTVASGEAYLHPAVTRKVLAKFNQGRPGANTLAENNNNTYYAQPSGRNQYGARERLSERELEVLQGVALGQNNREIAENLIVGEETVRTHLKSAFRKLGVNDRTQAVVVAVKQGFIKL